MEDEVSGNLALVKKIILLLGSNLGNRSDALLKATIAIEKEIGKIILQSKTYETDSWGNTDQPAFLNSVLQVETELPAQNILEKILLIEKEMGRVRNEKWSSRIIDIDILFYADEILEQNNLIIPHPQLHLRKFTLVPLAEIIPHYIHPVLKKSVAQLLAEINDTLEVKVYASKILNFKP